MRPPTRGRCAPTVVALLATLLCSNAAQALGSICGTQNTRFDAYVATPVYLLVNHANGVENLFGGDITSLVQIEDAVREAVEIWTEDGQANRTLYYAGTTSYDFTGDVNYPNRVLIRVLNSNCECGLPECESACEGKALCSGSGNNRVCTQSFIRLRRGPELLFGENKYWSLTPRSGNICGSAAECGVNELCLANKCTGHRDLISIIVHELGHTLTLGHPNWCVPAIPQWDNTVMSNNDLGPNIGTTGRYLGAGDIENLYDGGCAVSPAPCPRGFGWRQWTAKLATASSSGGPWYAGSFGTLFVPDTGFGSATSDTEGSTQRLYIAYPFVRRVKLAVYTPSTGWSIHVPVDEGTSAGLTYNPVAVAATKFFGWQFVVVVWTSGEVELVRGKKIRYAFSWDGGTTWQYYYVKDSSGSDVEIDGNGVSITYDPRSDRFLLAYVMDDGKIATHTVDLWQTQVAGPAIDQNDGSGVLQTAPPAIACTPDNVSNNCMIVYRRRRRSDQQVELRTVRGYISTWTGQFVPYSEAEVEYNFTYGAAHGPSLATAGASMGEGSRPWVLARKDLVQVSAALPDRFDSSTHYADPVSIAGWNNDNRFYYGENSSLAAPMTPPSVGYVNGSYYAFYVEP